MVRNTVLPEKSNFGVCGSMKSTKPRTFIFDGVFDDQKNQPEIFEGIKDYVNSVIDG